MSQYWESVAARSDGHYSADELEMTAYRIVTEQVLYYADRHSRTAYWMIERYEREFRQALLPIGVDISVNRGLRYAFAIPKHAKAGTASMLTTALALVLRQIYDESARMGQLTDDGEVVCDLVELSEKFRLMTGKELPTKGKLDALMETMKRWGLARKTEESVFDDGSDAASIQPYAVIIRPAIADLLGEAAVARMLQFQTVATTTLAANDLNEAAMDAEEEAVKQ